MLCLCSPHDLYVVGHLPQCVTFAAFDSFAETPRVASPPKYGRWWSECFAAPFTTITGGQWPLDDLSAMVTSRSHVLRTATMSNTKTIHTSWAKRAGVDPK